MSMTMATRSLSRIGQVVQDLRARIGDGIQRRRLILWTLPGLAGLAAVLLLLWSDVILGEKRMVVSNMELATAPMQDNLAMLSPRIAGTDRYGRPYVLSADRATQPDPQSKTVRLAAPKADLTLKTGQWVALNGAEGELNRDLDILDLFGAVSVFRDDGLTFETTNASIDLKGGEASGNDPVHGQGDFGVIDAEGGFHIQGEGTNIIFRGKSKLHLNGSRGGGEG